MKSLVRLATAALLLATAVSVHAAPLDGARQLIVVTSEGWDSTQGQLQAMCATARAGTRMDRRSRWRSAAPAVPGAWACTRRRPTARKKQEGDGRSPAGIFALGSAFGYAVTRRGTAMPYQPMLDSSYCMDVPGSPFYNRIVDEKKVGNAAVKGSTEPMRLDLHNKGDVRYREAS